jgi:thiamine-phosphate pyrophosphorylase
MNMRALKLCLVTNKKNIPFDVYRSFVLKAVQGGVTSVQLREKTTNLDEFEQMARQLQSILKRLNVPLIINDHVEIAKRVDASGIHLGQSDISPMIARQILGPDKWIGLSIETEDQLEIANQLTCIDYVAASAVFPSKTKPDCTTVWGIHGLRRLTELSKHPVMAIGGITHANIDLIIDSGASGAAVVGAIHDASCPRAAAKKLIDQIDHQMDRRKTLCLSKW